MLLQLMLQNSMAVDALQVDAAELNRVAIVS